MIRAACGNGKATGFALAAAVFAIVIIGALVTGGYFLSTQQFRMGKGGLQANSAFYAAEAGLDAALSYWTPADVEGLEPGGTIPLRSGELPSGDRYEVWLTRLDVGQDDATTYFALRSVGRAAGPYGGRRQVALVTRAHRPDALCCDAALKTRGAVRVTGSSVIDGFDSRPPEWAGVPGVCDREESSGDRPGVILDDRDRFGESGNAEVKGDPPVTEEPLGDEDFFVYGDLTYAELVEYADHEYPAGTSIHDTGPVVDVQGECARNVRSNWGEPKDPGHVCFDFSPIIHVAGGLRIDSSDHGQGILLVDGDLEIRGGYEFFGAVIVRGRFTTAGTGGRIHGGVIAYNADLGTQSISGNTVVNYSSCVVLRAAEHSNLSVPHPLAQRAWLELLD